MIAENVTVSYGGIDAVKNVTMKFKEKSVTALNQELKYDYLVVALGAELAPDLIPGLPESAFSYYSFEETLRLQKALTDFKGGTIGIVVCSLPYKCPGAPHERAYAGISDRDSRSSMRVSSPRDCGKQSPDRS